MEKFEKGYRAFWDRGSVKDFFKRKKDTVLSEIYSERPQQIVKDPNSFISKLKDEYLVDELFIDEDNIKYDFETKLVDSDFFPSSFNVERGSKYPKRVFITYIPITGPRELIRYRPSSCETFTPLIHDYNEGIYFEQIAFSDKEEEEINNIKENRKKNIECIKRHIEYINEDIRSGNEDLSQFISKKVQEILGEQN